MNEDDDLYFHSNHFWANLNCALYAWYTILDNKISILK